MKVIHKQHQRRNRFKIEPSAFQSLHKKSNPQFDDLYIYQLALLRCLRDGDSIHVTKARQIGMTTLAVMYAELTIKQTQQRPQIISFNRKMEREIENRISQRVGNVGWKDLPVGWVMLDETEWINPQSFLGVDCRKYQVFSYSSVNQGLPSNLINRWKIDESVTISYNDYLKDALSEDDRNRIIKCMGESSFRQDYLCERGLKAN